MELSLGYLKDSFAFLTATLCIVLFYIFKITPPKILLPIGIFLIFISDGIFTFFPSLHNTIL
jgi:hypothetical protein